MARRKAFETTGVIDKAIDVFVSKGYEATSVKDLVDATGLHPGSLYNSFGSKKQMFQAALDRFYAVSPFNRVLLDDVTAPRLIMQRLFAGIANPVGRAKTYDQCLITNAAAELGESDPDLTGRLQNYFEVMEDRICRVIERGQKSGDFATGKSARDQARFMLSIIQGMSLLARLGEDRKRLKAVAKMAMASLLRDQGAQRATGRKKQPRNVSHVRVRTRALTQ